VIFKDIFPGLSRTLSFNFQDFPEQDQSAFPGLSRYWNFQEKLQDFPGGMGTLFYVFTLLFLVCASDTLIKLLVIVTTVLRSLLLLTALLTYDSTQAEKTTHSRVSAWLEHDVKHGVDRFVVRLFVSRSRTVAQAHNALLLATPEQDPVLWFRHITREFSESRVVFRR